jgi:hypothetical protein
MTLPTVTDILTNPNGADSANGQTQSPPGAPLPTPVRGVLVRADGRTVIGRVGAPPKQEATSAQFAFWVPPDALVERTQLVTCQSTFGGSSFTFYAIVDEVYRCSRKNTMGHEVDESDNDLSFVPPFGSEGYTYATATILGTEPAVLVPPRERSDVLLASAAETELAYGADEIARPLSIALIKNGGDRTAGVGKIDLDYLLGVNGGGMNANGSAGRGTKSSFLLHTNWLLREARRQAQERPSDPDRPPIGCALCRSSSTSRTTTCFTSIAQVGATMRPDTSACGRESGSMIPPRSRM